MRKVFLSLIGLASFCAVSAQFSVGVNANYSKYGGNLSQGTTGFGARASYEQDRTGGYLSFTNGLPITQTGTVDLIHNTGGASKEVAAEGKHSFKTFTLIGTRTLIGDAETAGKFYLGFGASYVIAKYSETIKESYDKNVYTAPDMYNDSESGFTINGLLGGEYKIGRPFVFAEIGFAFPANQVNETYVENVIPAHLVFNLGVKLPLTSND